MNWNLSHMTEVSQFAEGGRFILFLSNQIVMMEC